MWARFVVCRSVLVVVVIFALSVVSSRDLRADMFNWVGGGATANWDDQTGSLYGNWGTIALPSAASDVRFGLFLTSGNPQLNGSRIVNSVTDSRAGKLSILGNPGDTLTLVSGNFTQDAGAATTNPHPLFAPVAIQANGTWDINGGGVTVNGGVTSSFGGSDHKLTKTGVGPLTLSGGPTTLSTIVVSGGAMTLDGGTVNLTALADSLVGNNNAGTSLTVQGGSTLTMGLGHGVELSGTMASPALMTVTGVGTSWSVGGTASIGLLGPGQLTMDAGATATIPSVAVGNGDLGTLAVQGGATLSDLFGTVGLSFGVTSTATVSGAGSQWNNTNELSLGGLLGTTGGNGVLNVSDHGLVTAPSIIMYNGGAMNVNAGRVVAGALSSDGTGGSIVLVADNFDGPSLTVNGASGSSTYGGVISGAGTLFKSGGSTLTLTAANTMTGFTTIAGGQIVLGNPLALQSSIINLQTDNGLNLNGLPAATIGTLTGTGNLNLGATALTIAGNTFNTTYSGNLNGSGRLIKNSPNRLLLTGTNNFMALTEINGGAVEVDGKLQGLGVAVNAGGTLQGVGQVAGNVIVNNGGKLAPGNGVGILTVQSAFFQSGSELNIALHGTTRGSDYGSLVATNDLVLGGVLRLLISGFSPAAGESFDLMDWGTITGKFGGLLLPTLDEDLMWNYSRLYTDGVLGITIAGDYNGNGIVDAADYTVWRDTLGQTGTGLAADGESDQVINGTDLFVWRTHFGMQVGPGAGAGAAVPEPGSLVLLTLAVACACARRRRVARRTALARRFGTSFRIGRGG